MILKLFRIYHSEILFGISDHPLSDHSRTTYKYLVSHERECIENLTSTRNKINLWYISEHKPHLTN